MNFQDIQYVEEHRREMLREAEQHRLAKAAREGAAIEQKPGLSFPMSLLESLIPQPPKPEQKPVRRPAC